MGISNETLQIWDEIKSKVEKKIRAKMSNQDEAEEVISEVKVLFLTRDFPYKHAPQAYNYAVTNLYKQALGEEDITPHRVCIGDRTAYAAAIKELGDNPTREEIEEVEDIYRPKVVFTSYEALTEEGWDQEAAEVDPLNPSGFDKRISAYLANPRINPIAKAMALQILDGDTLADVAERHGCSIQTVSRRLAGEVKKLDQELQYVVKNVVRKAKKVAKVIPLPVATTPAAKAEAWEETIELDFDAPTAEIAEEQTPVVAAQEVVVADVPMAKVINLNEFRRGRAVHTSSPSWEHAKDTALVSSLATWRHRLTARAAPPPDLTVPAAALGPPLSCLAADDYGEWRTAA